MAKPRASLERAVEWIAHNDDTACMNSTQIAEQMSVVLVADIWGQPAAKLARWIVRLRSEQMLDAPTRDYPCARDLMLRRLAENPEYWLAQGWTALADASGAWEHR